jgi:hypothetical protein
MGHTVGREARKRKAEHRAGLAECTTVLASQFSSIKKTREVRINHGSAERRVEPEISFS